MAIINVSYRHKPGRFEWLRDTETDKEWEDKPTRKQYIEKTMNAGKKKKPASKKIAKAIIAAAESVVKNGDPHEQD